MKKQNNKYAVASLLAAFVLTFSNPVFAKSELHKGSINFGSSQFDGDERVSGNTHGFENSSSAVGAEFFLTEQVSFNISKDTAKQDYSTSRLNNLTCDIDTTALGLRLHSSRVNYRDGTGTGLSIGILSVDGKADCEDDYFIYPTIDSDSESIVFTWEKGVGNGEIVSLSLVSDTDDFLDDRRFSFGLSKILNNDIFVGIGVYIAETAEDTNGNNTEVTGITFSVSYLF